MESDLGSTILGNDPGSRSFAAAVSTLGVTPAKLELAFAYDEAGSLAVTVLGFRIPGISPTKLRPLVLETWLSATAPGVKSSSVTIGGIATTKVTYGDEGSDEYVLVRGDAVFVVETSGSPRPRPCVPSPGRPSSCRSTGPSAGSAVGVSPGRLARRDSAASHRGRAGTS